MSVDLKEKGKNILREDGLKNNQVYRGFLELVSRFGYASIDEMMYGFGLDREEAHNRLGYLRRANLIEKFPSQTKPDTFYCLASKGRRVVEDFNICEEIHPFRWSNYNLSTQQHHRTVIKIFLAFKKIYGGDLIGWVSETQLKQESEQQRFYKTSQGKRVLDGEFILKIYKKRFSIDSGIHEELGISKEAWRCGLEFENTLKSRERYRKQFRSLAGVVYDPFEKQQLISLILFLCSSPKILERLTKHLKETDHDFGRCIFIFGVANQFLEELEKAPLRRFVGTVNSNSHAQETISEARRIQASELNHIQVREIHHV